MTACNSHMSPSGKVKEFKNDWFQHIHEWNNILFPKPLQRQNEALQQNNSN